MKTLRFLALVAPLVMWTACFLPVTERICDERTPCGSGLVCVNGLCLVPGTGGGAGGGGIATGGGFAGGGGSGGGIGGGSGGGAGCFDGCLDGFGQCHPGNTASQCGTGSALCVSCGTNAHCEQGKCVTGCGAQSCSGCCAGGTSCLSFSQQNVSQCGNGGASCGACQNGAVCAAGRCLGGTCNAMTCPDGCCQNGFCVDERFQSSFACGANGNACMGCPRGQTCTNGTCVNPPQCNASTCANGCCQNGFCIPSSVQNPSMCGVGGGACAACPPNSTCSNGVCTGVSFCDSNTCPNGCCQGDFCLPGNTQTQCGVKGLQCAACGMGQVCAGGQCVATSCSPMSCPNGCCQNGVCRNGNSTQSCGRGGQVCSTCASGQVCRMGNCESPTVEVGTACISDAQCSSLGMAAYCKQFTSTFNASYQGGYCTLKCSNAPSQSSCPMNAFCLTVPNRGEDDNFCARRCGFGSQCRSPGYACYGVQGPSNTNVCWIFPAPGITTDAGTGGGSGGGGGGGGSIPDAGPRTLGAPCSSGAQCTGLAGPICIPDQVPGFGSTGYAGGYCTTSCGPTGFCPQSGMCITETFFGNTTSTCKTTCPAPLMGQSTCRAGYLCLPSPISSTFDGGFPAGWCGPPCNALLGQCSAGTSCGADGYCH